MRGLQLIALLGVLLTYAGCAGRPKIDRLTDASVVVAFGDSLTSGTGAGKAENYPSVLSQLIGCPVINAGVAGEDTTEGRRRLPAVLARGKPDLVIICHGGNDMLSRRNPGTIAANLDAMISLVKASGSDAILVGVPRPGLILKAPPFYRSLARSHAIPFEPDIVARVLSTPSLKSDQIHPNAAGYRRLAEAVASLIRTSHRE